MTDGMAAGKGVIKKSMELTQRTKNFLINRRNY